MMPKKWVARLLAKLMVRYPMLARQVETEELADMWIQEWADGLKGVNPKNIKTGLEEDLNRESDFPPSIGVFRGLCKVKARKGMYAIRKIDHKSKKYKPDFKKLKEGLR
jgi:hypothetical protein